jgi:predicted RNase H-like nuclease
LDYWLSASFDAQRVNQQREASLGTAIFSGFDSAWTDDPKRPGALAHIVAAEDRLEFLAPELRTFDHALTELLRLGQTADLHLVALDQPTIVPNLTGCRPVERVVASVICKLKGGVQPSSRSRLEMFGDNAPVWRFLRTLNYDELPFAAHRATSGRYLIEVFPALSIASMFPRFAARSRLPKYNPQNRRTFAIEDWRLLMDDLGEYAIKSEITGLEQWAHKQRQRERPAKPDQDRADAAICALQALDWWRHGLSRNAVIGDGERGYMVAAVIPATEAILKNAAQRVGVRYCMPW